MGLRVFYWEGVKEGFYYIIDFVSFDSGFLEMEWEKVIDRLRREIFFRF